MPGVTYTFENIYWKRPKAIGLALHPTLQLPRQMLDNAVSYPAGTLIRFVWKDQGEFGVENSRPGVYLTQGYSRHLYDSGVVEQ